MRRVFFILLALCTALSATACTPDDTQDPTVPTYTLSTEDITGYRVPSPLAYPDYTFTDTPDTMQLRLMAVQAMHDLLSIQWSTVTEIVYRKTGPVSEKLFSHEPDTTYAGVLYSSASTGLFTFLEFYDHNTGRLVFNGTNAELKKTVGSSCADALIWSLNTVCNSLSGLYYPSTMTYANGYYPVGEYTYDFSVNNYTLLPTYTIMEQNSKEIIMESYAQVLPADALVSTSDNHGMMAIESAHVVYNADSKINTAESYILIQDQRGGQGSGFYEQTVEGKSILYSGRTSAKYTFDQLYEKHYLPVTTAEFSGRKAYEPGTCTQVTCESYEQLLVSRIESNYPLVLVNAYLTGSGGSSQLIERTVFSGDSKGGVPKVFSLADMDRLSEIAFMQDLVPGQQYTLWIEAVISTGQRFTAAQLEIVP